MQGCGQIFEFGKLNYTVKESLQRLGPFKFTVK